MDKKFNQQLNQKLQQSYEQLSAKAPEGLWEQLQLHLPEVELDQQLDEKVQEGYEQLSVVAPTGLWENLEQALSEEELNQQLEDKVGDSYKGLLATAPLGLWEGIQKSLPANTGIDQQLDEKLKEGFAQQTAKAVPVALWSAISEELGTTVSLDEQLDQKVKASFIEEQPKAPHKVWTAVNRQLNIDRTWQKISAALDAPAKYIDWKLRGLQGLVLALLLLLWVRTCNKVPEVATPVPAPIAVGNAVESQPIITNKKGLDKGKTASKKQQITTAMLETPQQAKKQETSGNQVANANSSATLTTAKEELEEGGAETKNTISYNNHNKQQVVVSDNDNQNTTANNPLTAVLGIEQGNMKANAAEISSNKKEKEQQPAATFDLSATKEAFLFPLLNTNQWLSPKVLEALELPIKVPEELELANEPSWKSKFWTPENKLAVGVFIAVNSTALLNNETREGFDYNSLTINYFGLAANYGLWARYRLGKRGALMAEYSLNADHRQAYGVYQKGKFAIKEYVFKYNRFSLAYQLDLWQHAKHPNNKITAQVGAYVGALRASQLYYNKVLVNDNIGEYHHYDGGLKLALGHELAIEHFVIGYGIRSDIGLANIFKGNQNLNGQQNRTNLIHLGGYIHLGYQF